MNADAAIQALLMFLLELGLFGAAGFWALSVFDSPWAAVLAVIVVAAAWGLVLSPKAPARPPWPWHTMAGHMLFLIGAVVLFVGGWPALGWAYLALILVSAALTVRFRQRLAIDSTRAREDRREGSTVSGPRPVRPTGRRAAGRD